MISLKQWMELVNYRVTEGQPYGWNCFGENAYSLSSWNGIYDEGGFSSTVVFDTANQTVYEVDICDYTRSRAYRLINPDYVKSYRSEAEDRLDGRWPDEAWDDVKYIDLEVDGDFLEKCGAIVRGEDYDHRVVIPLELSDKDMLTVFRLAHEQDLSLNAYVEKVLRDYIRDYGNAKLLDEIDW